jgi:hypothetical protein
MSEAIGKPSIDEASGEDLDSSALETMEKAKKFALYGGLGKAALELKVL